MRKIGTLRRAVWHLRHGGATQLRQFLDRGRATRRTPGIDGELRDSKGNLTFEPWPIPERQPRRDLRVAVILDEFSRLAFSYEWQQVEITPMSWRTELTERPVDLLFVESAWHGNGDAWQYHLTGTSAPRLAFIELVEWCKEQGVPTVFWNKEDPAHYADFLDSARLFDHVFTTDVNRLRDYVRDLGHDRVAVLPFAAQPAIHNPIRPAKAHQSRDIAFAGMYFAHKYPERREQMDLLLGAAHDVSPRMDKGLEIFSRYLGADETYQFPPPLDARVVGSLDYQRMLTAYRAYKVFLNVNSVVDSPSMCARRIFEITASGTPVVSGPSRALDNYFPADEVARLEDPAELRLLLRALVRNPELRDRSVHKAQRRIWREHTYAVRADAVLRAVSLPTALPTRAEVTALVSSNRPKQLGHVLDTLGSQECVKLQVALLTHGWTVNRREFLAEARDRGIEDVIVLEAGADDSLGVCLNRLVSVADSPFVAKIDDDDIYGANYLADQVSAFEYSGAQVVGKHAHYVYLESQDLTALRFSGQEHRYTDFVLGPTIVSTLETMRAIPFANTSTGEDTRFLDDARRAGALIYSADRYNFLFMRHSRKAHQHTWSVSDVDLLANSTVKFHGYNTAPVIL